MKKIILLILIVTGMQGLTGCVNTTTVEGIEFKLNGDVIVDITTAQSYLELGFKATNNGTSINSYVTVSGTVDSSTPGTYIIKYTLDYENTQIELIRAVNVTQTTEVVDPNEILYDGTCANVQIHFIDLGAMGDSTLIDCGDFEILIDAGLKSAGTNVVVPYITPYIGDGVLELVIATHPDADHFGGFIGLSDQDGIFDAFTVLRVLDFGYIKTTDTYEQYAEVRDASGALVCSGDDALNSRNLCQPYYTITEDLILRVIETGKYDGVDTTNDNENSIVVMLEHGSLKYLFTGDAEFEAEEHMATVLEHVDVYKAGHHGSKTASSQDLLDVITPNDIILGVYFPEDDDGENGYGIPQQESLDRMFGITDNIYATGVSGTIIITSNGTTYNIVGELNTTLFKDSQWFLDHRIYPTE